MSASPDNLELAATRLKPVHEVRQPSSRTLHETPERQLPGKLRAVFNAPARSRSDLRLTADNAHPRRLAMALSTVGTEIARLVV